MGTLTRTIEVDSLEDIASYINEEALKYEEQSHTRGLTKVQQGEARGYAKGVRWAARVVEDTHLRK